MQEITALVSTAEHLALDRWELIPIVAIGIVLGLKWVFMILHWIRN